MQFAVAASCSLGLLSIASAQETEGLRPAYYKKWRENPKMVVFGDSTSDAGRRFNAPAAFHFDDIGPFPWTNLFDAPDSDSTLRAYLPAPGSVSNGKVWPSWLRVPEELNFATSSASATDTFRSLETCRGYTGEGEEFPTGTLSQQVTRYFYDILDETNSTLGFSHIIAVGGNEPSSLLDAATRYSTGGAGYVDPVPFEDVFEVVDGVPTLTFEPMIRGIIGAWQEAITRLIERGVTGKIFLTNIPSFKGLPGIAESGIGDVLEQVSVAVNTAAQLLFEATPQVQMLDIYRLSAAIVDQPEVFESLGFTGGSGSSLSEPCLRTDFALDTTAEVMGTQADRAAGCREECAICADLISPCQNCYQGNPSATVCDDPEKYLFWDTLHFTTDFHRFLAEATRQCTKASPDQNTAWVELLCPPDA